MIPYGRQDIDDADIAEVVAVLKSDFLTQGPVRTAFEKAVASYCQASYATAVNSATSALHLACLAMDLGPGDYLWTSPITFVASANCALYCGAKVDFVDIDPQTHNLCPDRLEEKLAEAEKQNKLPKIVVAVHMAGLSCDMARIQALAARYDFKVIEDASHAIGARYHDAPVGNGAYSDATIFSFHPVKIITSGEGGMVVTNDQKLHDKVQRLSSHGVTRDPALMIGASDGDWYYQQIELGLNYRMTDIHAALGLSQLRKLDDYIARRNEIAAHYTQAFDGVDIICPHIPEECLSSYHLYIIKIDHAQLKLSKKELFSRLRQEGLGVNVHYIPVHLQPYYKNLGFKQGDFPLSEAYYEQAISIPMFPTMSDEQIERTTSVIKANLR